MRFYSIILVFIILLSHSAFPCSTAIISGKVTDDGRPLLWKHRDARDEENDLRYFKGEKFDFIGLVNTKDTTGTQVWMGSNSAGFSIINANCYNLDKGSRYKGPMDLEGYVMKEALATCATLADFETMLEKTTGTRGTLATFGVMDAQGGGAMYETSPDSYVKYDINDPAAAKKGYIIRTNYGFSGKGRRGSGYIRYNSLEKLFDQKMSEGKLTVDFILLKATRSLYHSLMNIDLYKGDLPEDGKDERFIFFRDYVVGGGSVSAMVIQGVKPGEDPALTTLWTIPAFQLTSLTVPTWVAAGENLPGIVQSREGNAAPLSRAALELKHRCFPMKTRDGRGYLNIAPLLNKKGDGYLQKILPMDETLIKKSRDIISKWRERGFKKTDALQHYKWLDSTISEFYEKDLNVSF
jgi:hypothetical protein